MNSYQLIFTLLLAGAFITGCATRRNAEQAAMLALPCVQFDQTLGSGW